MVLFFFILHTLDVQLLLVAEVSTTISEGPKNRYERLENRISSSLVIHLLAPNIILQPDELEMLLRQKENHSGRSHSPSNGHLAGLPAYTPVSPSAYDFVVTQKRLHTSLRTSVVTMHLMLHHLPVIFHIHLHNTLPLCHL